MKTTMRALPCLVLLACEPDYRGGGGQPLGEPVAQQRITTDDEFSRVACSSSSATEQIAVLEGTVRPVEVETMDDGWVITWYEIDELRVIDTREVVAPFRLGIPGGVTPDGTSHLVTHHPVLQSGDHILAATVDRGRGRRGVYDVSGSLFMRSGPAGAETGRLWTATSESLLDAEDDDADDGVLRQAVAQPQASRPWVELVGLVQASCARRSATNP